STGQAACRARDPALSLLRRRTTRHLRKNLSRPCPVRPNLAMRFVRASSSRPTPRRSVTRLPGGRAVRWLRRLCRPKPAGRGPAASARPEVEAREERMLPAAPAAVTPPAVRRAPDPLPGVRADARSAPNAVGRPTDKAEDASADEPDDADG